MLRSAFRLKHLYRTGWRFSEFLNNERQRAVCLKNISNNYQRSFATAAHNIQESVDERSKLDFVSVESIDNALAKIDQDAKRFGNVSKRHVDSVYSKIKSLGKASSIQCLYLLRCCGSLMSDEMPHKRTELANDIWKTVEQLKIPVDASHYNALMKVYLENEHTFSPVDFLSNMERNGIEPNRVTFQRLIEKYCQDGDLNGASVVLEHMKEKGIAANEAVFNSLIKGHAKSGDFDGAQSMFTMMKKSGLALSVAPYLTLACGYAEKGDLDGVIKTLDKAEVDGLYLANVDLLSVIYSLIASGHGDKIEQVFARLRDIQFSRRECVDVIHKLMSKGFFEESFDFLKLVSSHINFEVGATEYIRDLVASDKPINEVLERCQDLCALNYNAHSIYLAAGKEALHHQKSEHAITLFKEFLKAGLPLRCHYFYPLLVAEVNAKNEKGILDILRAMSDLGVLGDFETFYSFVLPGLSLDDLEMLTKKISETGQPLHCVIHPLLKTYCFSGNYKNALSLCERYGDGKFGATRILFDGLVYSYKGEDDASLLKLIQLLCSQPSSGKNLTKEENRIEKDPVGTFFVELSRLNKLTRNLLKKAHEMGIGLTASTAKIICNNIGRGDPELIQMVRSLEYGAPLPTSSKDMDYVHPRDMDFKTLENHVAQLRESGFTTRVALRHLLLEYCKRRNLEKILSIMEELENDGFQYTPAVYAMLIGAFADHHDLERAEDLLKKLKEEYPETKLDNVKAINYGILLIKNGRCEEALQFIKTECDEVNFARKEMLIQNVKKLLFVVAETGDVNMTNDLFDHFVNKLQIASPQYMSSALVNVHLSRGDPTSAVGEYKNCLERYNFGPSRLPLLKKFITAKDFAKLQEVVDATTLVNGKIPTLHELAFAFIECGHVQEARKVFQTLGDKADTLYMEKLSDRLMKNQKVSEMENLIEATKGLMQIDRDKLYYNLLTLYAQENDCEKALELWNCIQEENIQPSAKTLNTLANLLEKNGHSVPFVVPMAGAQTLDEVPAEEVEPVSEVRLFISDLEKYVELEKADEIVETFNKMKKGHVRALSTDLMTKVVDVLIQKNSLREIGTHVQAMSYILERSRNIFKPLMEKYADQGNVEVFNYLLEFLPDFTLKSISFNYFFNKAHIVSGRHEELLSALQSNVGKSVKLFSLFGFMELLKLSPEFEKKVVELADSFEKIEQFVIPRKGIWIHYFINERFQEADKLFRENPELFTTMDVMATQVLRNIKSTGNENVGRKFIEFVTKYNMHSAVKDRAYSCLFEVLVQKSNHEAAVKLLEEAQEANTPISSFSQRTLLALKSQLEENGKAVPFSVREKDSDGSSSSDSD